MAEEKDIEQTEEEVAALTKGDEAGGDAGGDAETPAPAADTPPPAADDSSATAFDDNWAKYLCCCCCAVILLPFIVYAVAWIFSDECTAEKPVKSFEWFPPKYECYQCLEQTDCENPDVETCDTRSNTCAGIPEEGYPVWLPAEERRTYKKLDIPRKVVDGPVMEQIWYFDLNEQPNVTKDDIQFNGTHVAVPLYREMLAGYSRAYNMYGESETGIVTLSFLSNLFSVVTEKPYAALVEKYHMLTYSGNWSEFAWSRRGIIRSQVESGVDKVHLKSLRKYVKGIQDGEIPYNTTVNSTGWQSHREKAIEAIALAKDTSFVPEHKKSENHCKHFEQDMGLEYDEAALLMWFPVGSPITTLSGEMVFTPTYSLGFNVAITTVDYNPETGILQIYYRGYAQMRQYTDLDIPKEDWPYPSGLWVSSPGPEMKVSEQDGRTVKALNFEEPPDNKFDGLLGIDYEIDYTIFARPIEETCNPDTIDRIDNDWEDVRLGRTDLTGFEAVLNGLEQTYTMLRVANAGVLCGGYYMRNDYGSDSFGYELNEQGVWLHLLLEVEPAHTKDLVTANWWDHWDCFYKGKDVQECT